MVTIEAITVAAFRFSPLFFAAALPAYAAIRFRYFRYAFISLVFISPPPFSLTLAPPLFRHYYAITRNQPLCVGRFADFHFIAISCRHFQLRHSRPFRHFISSFRRHYFRHTRYFAAFDFRHFSLFFAMLMPFSPHCFRHFMLLFAAQRAPH